MEIEPETPVPLLVLSSCSLDTPRLSCKLHINVSLDTLAYRIYKQNKVDEVFSCNYELNPVYRSRLEAHGLKVSGESDDGGARIVELPDHRFFLATGFLPQYNSDVAHPHPVIMSYLKATLK